MCASGWLEQVADRCSFQKGTTRAPAEARSGGGSSVAPTLRPGFSRVIDLTHTLSPDFPTYSGVPEVAFEEVLTYERDRKNVKRWLLQEHIGTHLDAPIHFSSDGQTADEVPVESLVVPLAIIDIRERAQDDADAQVTPDDVLAWESKHGPLPSGSCVAMNSGWDRFASSARFRNADDGGTMHFPGFHVEAAHLLIQERHVVGLGVDTLSLDHGPSTEYPTHYAWLPTNRWAVEGLANLALLPPVGATLVVGGPKVRGATGGLSRILALL